MLEQFFQGKQKKLTGQEFQIDPTPMILIFGACLGLFSLSFFALRFTFPLLLSIYIGGSFAAALVWTNAPKRLLASFLFWLSLWILFFGINLNLFGNQFELQGLLLRSKSVCLFFEYWGNFVNSLVPQWLSGLRGMPLKTKRDIFTYFLMVLPFSIFSFAGFCWISSRHPFLWFRAANFFLIPNFFIEGLIVLIKKLFPRKIWQINSPNKKDKLKRVESKKNIKKEEFFLGKDALGKNHFLSEKNLAYHLEIVAPTGSGKTNLLKNIVQQRIKTNQGVLFFDCKAEFELVSWIYNIARKYKRESDVRLISLSDPELSCPYNPLQNKDPQDLHSILMNSMTWSEPYYRSVSSVALMILSQALFEHRERSKKEFGLETLLSILADPDERQSFVSDCQSLRIPSLEELENFVELLTSAKQSEALSGLIANLRQMIFSSAKTILKPRQGSSFSFSDAIGESQIVIVLLNSLKLKESASSLGKMMLQDLMSYAGNFYSKEKEVGDLKNPSSTLIIDEFASFATPEFISFLDRARGAGIGVVMAHQSRSDLSAISPDFQARIEANCNSMIVSGVKTKEEAEFYSGLLGTKAGFTDTVQMQSLAFLESPTGMKSRTQADSFVLNPNQLRQLSQGEVFYLAKNVDPKWGIVKVLKAEENKSKEIDLRQALKEICSKYSKIDQIDEPLPKKKIRHRQTKNKIERKESPLNTKLSEIPPSKLPVPSSIQPPPLEHYWD